MAKVEHRDCPKSLGRACSVALRSTETVLFDLFSPPFTSQIHGQNVAHTPFRTVSEGEFSGVRQLSGKLGAPRLPLARDNSVEHMINKVIVEPLSLALNALSPETQPLRYCAALLVLCCARDYHPVQAEFKNGVIH